MSTWIKMAIVVLAAVLGGLGGYWIRGSVEARSDVVIQRDQLVKANAEAEQRVKDEHAAAERARQELADERDKTTDLNAQLGDVRSKNAALQEQIDHAPLDAPKPPPVAGQCPGNPLSGDDFGRLYERAAQGDPAARP